MDAQKTTLWQLFSDQRVYVIPVFQREYVWNAEGQWEPFAADLCAKALQLVEADQHKEDVAPHFFGAIVIKSQAARGMSLARHEVIDGQQRLLTCLVFLKALSHVLLGLGIQGHAGLDRLIRNEERDGGSDEFLKIRPSHRDRQTFSDLMVADSDAAFLRTDRSSLAEAYRFFRGASLAFLEQDADGGTLTADVQGERARGLLAALRTATFAYIGLSENEDPTEVFEALNGRGEPLLASDLIRNFVFRAADNVGLSQAEQVTLYEMHWLDFSSRRDPDDDGKYFWHQAGTKGIARIEQFFMHFLQCQMPTEKEIRTGDLLRAFRKWWDDSGWKGGPSRQLVESRVRLIRQQAEVYASFYELPADLEAFGPFFLRLCEYEQSTVYAVLLYLFGTALPGGRVTQQDLVLICGMVESYLVRRFVCRMSTNKYNHLFLGLVAKLHKLPQITAAGFQQALDSYKGESELWPSDDEFRRHWDTEKLYAAGNRRKTLQAMLSAIDQKLQPAFGEDVTVRYDALTVEHVLPQQWEANWPLGELTGDVRGRFQPGTSDREIRGTLLHSIGNLTLLTQKLNTSMKNAPYEDKREKILVHSSLPLNKHFQKRETWDEAAILARAATLFTTACQIWPGPKADAGSVARSNPTGPACQGDETPPDAGPPPVAHPTETAGSFCTGASEATPASIQHQAKAAEEIAYGGPVATRPTMEVTLAPSAATGLHERPSVMGVSTGSVPAAHLTVTGTPFGVASRPCSHGGTAAPSNCGTRDGSRLDHRQDEQGQREGDPGRNRIAGIKAAIKALNKRVGDYHEHAVLNPGEEATPCQRRIDVLWPARTWLIGELEYAIDEWFAVFEDDVDVAELIRFAEGERQKDKADVGAADPDGPREWCPVEECPVTAAGTDPIWVVLAAPDEPHQEWHLDPELRSILRGSGIVLQ